MLKAATHPVYQHRCSAAAGGGAAAGESCWWCCCRCRRFSPLFLALLLPRPTHPPLPSCAINQVDELLVQCGVALTGSGACDAVTIRHAGLTLFPLDEEQVDPAHPLHVMAAFLPAADLAGSSVSVSVSGSGSGSGSGSSSGERS